MYVHVCVHLTIGLGNQAQQLGKILSWPGVGIMFHTQAEREEEGMGKADFCPGITLAFLSLIPGLKSVPSSLLSVCSIYRCIKLLWVGIECCLICFQVLLYMYNYICWKLLGNRFV